MRQMRFLTPVEGQMLSDTAGSMINGKLIVEAIVEAEPDAHVFINGIPATYQDGRYAAQVAIGTGKTILRATDDAGNRDEVCVDYLSNAACKYSLSLDDNIWALADLNAHGNDYRSIFDNPYFRVYQQAHEQYGAKVRMNLFYQMDNPCGLEMYGPFDLSMMTQRYKEEFRHNADWLRFAFHARQEFPDKIHEHVAYADMLEVYRRIQAEVTRFAGEEAFESAVTTVHWGACSPEGIAAAQELGLKCLMGYMETDENGHAFVSYNLTPEQIQKVNEYGFWRDPSCGMIYGKIAAVLNTMDQTQAIRRLDAERTANPKRGYMEIMIHEQYFYPSYSAYLPDFAARVMNGCRWCVENGYRPAFISEMLN